MGAGFYLKRADSARFYLGPQDAGTSFNGLEFKLWFSQGTLPAGSMLKSVSADLRLDSVTGDSWASDLALVLYTDGNPLLQVGGYENLPGVVTISSWSGGYDGPGTRFTDRKLVVTDFPDLIDLHDTSVNLWNGYDSGGPSSWSGTLDFTFVPTL